MLSRSVHWKFSHPPSCFQTISNTHLKTARKRIEPTHPFLCFTSPRSPSFYLFFVLSGVEQMLIIFKSRPLTLSAPFKETEIYCILQLHLSKVYFVKKKKRETKSYCLRSSGSFLNPNEPSGPDTGPSTCSLPWRATSSPPSFQNFLHDQLVDCSTSHGSSHPEPKEEGVHQDGASFGPFMCSSIKGGKTVLVILSLNFCSQFLAPKKMQIQTQRPPLREGGDVDDLVSTSNTYQVFSCLNLAEL